MARSERSTEGARPKVTSTCPLVGVGASAGGLEAFKRLLAAIPGDTPLAFILVQHLDPSHQSKLAEILASSSNLPVSRAADGDVLAGGCVYVIPEGHTAFVEGNALRLGPRDDSCRELPIDMFFSSLAGQSGGGACGVLLSGTGSDGLVGLREIIAAGGLTFVQDPASSEYGGMPHAAIDAGVADFVGTPEQIADEIHARAGHRYLRSPAANKRASEKADEAQNLGAILALLNGQHAMDFSAYKKSTVRRRVGRRAMLRNVDTLGEYLALLREEPHELDALLGDMLINVTQFFRDPEVFAALKTRVFPAILANKKASDTVRIWVPGCSTGEEVYSLLMTLIEALDEVAEKPDIALFGSDASESAIRAARVGWYPDSTCAHVSPERLARFFVRRNDGYEVDRSLREMCIFARQDITRDTPFSRLDLVSLRNVLIYMERDLQKRVLAVAHYALSPGGFLVLGTSETPEGEARLFSAFDKQSHIYRRKDVAPHLPLDVTGTIRLTMDVAPPPLAGADVGNLGILLQDRANATTLEAYAPARVVADANAAILQFLGDTAPFLEQPQGKATHNLFEMARPGLALDLEEAFHESLETGNETSRELAFVVDGEQVRLSLDVVPLPAEPGEQYRLVVFRELPGAVVAAEDGIRAQADVVTLYESREARLRRELVTLRARLRGVSEDKDAVNQELRAANEEVRSSNEEFQSINEELETAKEELQSANEELITVNEELRQRNSELGLVNDDLSNFIGSTDIPVVMLDREMRIRRHTPQARRVMHILPSDEGRPLQHIRLRVDVSDLEALVAETIKSQEPQEREIQGHDGRWYSLQIRPYRSAEELVEGAVLSFIDVDDLKRSLEHVEQRAHLNAALNKVDTAVASTLDFDEIMQAALDEGVSALSADAGSIEIREGKAWVVRYQHGFRPEDVGTKLSEKEAPNSTRAAALREPLAIFDMRGDKSVNVGFVKSYKLKSVLAVPLIVKEAVIGCLLFYTAENPRAFDEAEIDFGRNLGASVSLALENAQLIEAERHAARTAATLAKINEILLSALTVDDVVARLVGEASQAAGADKSLIIRVHGDEYTVTDVRNMKRALVGKTRDRSFYPAFASAAEKRKPLLIGDTWNDPLTNKDFVIPNGLRAFQLLPLAPDAKVEAILALAYDEPQVFDDDDYASASRMAAAMSVALKNAQLFEAEESAQRRATQELEFTQVLLDSSAVFAEWTESRPMLDHLAEVLLKSSAHSRVTIGLWDEKRRELSTVVSKGKNPISASTTPYNQLSAPARRLVRTMKPVLIDYSLVKDESLRKLIAQRRLRFALGVPIVARGRLLGTITLDAPGEHKAFSDRETDLLESIATQAATAIENSRLFDAERDAQEQATRELETTTQLLKSARALAGWTDLPTVLDQLAKSVHVATGRQRVFVHQWDEDKPALVLAAAAGTGSAPLGSRYEWDKIAAPSKKALTEKRTMILDYDKIRSAEKKPYAGPMGFRVALAVPLTERSTLLGLIIVDDPGERHEFNPREIALVEGIAAQASSAIRTARLFEAEQAELARTTVLKEAAAAAAGTLDERELSERVLASSRKLLGAKAGSVYVIDRAAGNLKAAALFGFPAKLSGQMDRMDLDENRAAARSYLRDEIVMHDSPELPGGIVKRAKAAQATQNRWISLPIRARGELIGSLGLIFEGQQRPFEPDEIDLYQSLADQLGVGVDKARLFEAEQMRAGFAEALAEVDRVVHASLDFGEIADLALTTGAGAIAAETGAIIGRDGDGWLTWGSFNFEPSVVGVRLTDSENPHGVLALKTKKPVAVDDAYTDPRVDNKFMKGYGLRSVVVAPLIVRGEPIAGLYYNYNSEIHRFTDAEVDFVTKVASSLSLAFENARLFEAERTRAYRMTALKAVAEAAVSASELEDAAEAIAVAMRSSLAGTNASVALEVDGELRLLAAPGYPDEALAVISSLPDDAPAAQAFRSRAPVFLPDFEALGPELREATRQMGILSGASLPLLIGDRAIGAISMSWPEPHVFDADERAFLGSIAAESATGMQKALLFRAEQARLAETTLLRDVAAAAAETLDVAELSERVLLACERLLGAKSGNVYLFDSTEGALIAAGMFGFPEAARGRFQRLELDEDNASARAFLHGEFVTHDSPGLSESTQERESMAKVASNRWITVPIRGRGETFGSLGLVFEEPRAFQRNEIELYETLADQVAVGLDKARLFKAEQAGRVREAERAERIAALNEIAQIATSSLETKPLASNVVTAVAHLLEAKQAQIRLVNSEGTLLEPVATYDPAETFLARAGAMPVDAETETALCFRTHQPRVGEDIPPSISEESTRNAKAAAVRSYIITPICTGPDAIGTLYVAWGEPRHFEPEQVSFVEAVAAQLSLGVQNALLFEAEQAELARTALLKDVASAAAGALELGELATKVLATAHEHLGAKSGSVYLRDEKDGVLRHVALFGYPKKLLPSVAELPLDDTTVTGRAVLQGEMLTHESDVPNKTRTHATAARIAENRWVILPIRSRGEVVGTLGFVFEEMRPFSEPEISLFRSIASQLGTAIEKSRLFEAERQAREQAREELETTSLLLEAATILAESDDLASGLARLVETMRKAIPGVRSVIYRVDGDGSEVQVLASGGGIAPDVGARIALSSMTPAAREVLLTGKSQVVEFDRLPKRKRGLGKEFAVHKLLAVPVVFQGRALGMFVADDPADPHRSFSEREVGIIEAFAAQAAAAMENARLFEAEREVRRQVNQELEITGLLLETADTLARWTDVDVALEQLAEILLRATGQLRVTVNLWDEERQELRTVASKGKSPMAPATFPASVLSEQVRGVLATHETLLFDYDELPEGETRELAEERAIHLGLVVPIVYRDIPLGLIGVDSPGERREFSDREIELVQSVAAQASAAIRNAQLFEQVRDSEGRFHALFETMTEGFSVNEIILDEQGKPCDFRYLQVNPAFEMHTGLKAADITGKTLLELFPDSESVWIERYGKVALTGTPDHFQDQFGPLSRWFEVSVYQTQPGRFAVVFFDITRRKAAEEFASESNARLSDTLNSMTDGFVSVNRDWRFTLVNPQAEEMLHRSAAEVLGKSMKDLYPDMFGWPHYRKVMKKRVADTFEVWSKPLETWLEIHAYPTEEGISILFTDISARKRDESRAEARLRMSSAAGASETSSDDMIGLVLDEIESLTQSKIGFYHFVEADQETLWLQNWSTNTLANMCTAEGKGQHYPISEAGVWVEAVKERGPVIHNDYDALPNKKGLPEGHAPVIRELVVPVLRNGLIVALIGVGDKATDYDETDVDTVTYLGDFSWEMVERKRAEEALQQSRARVDLLATMLESSSQPFAAATGEGVLLDFNTAYEQLVGYSADELRALSWRTDLTPVEWQEVDAATMREQAMHGGPVRYEKEYLRKDGRRVPVEVVRNVQPKENGEVDYFYAFFTDITERKRADRLNSAADEINRTIHSTLEFETIMSLVSESAADALRCDSAEVLLLDGVTWVKRYSHGVPDSEVGRRLEMDEAPVATMAAAERHAVVTDVSAIKDKRVAKIQRNEGINSLLAVPMIVRDEVIGVLVFAYRDTKGSFSAADVDFAENLAASVSLGVENARLYERERTIADTLQEAVLTPPEPNEAVEVSFVYRPASETANVGGDFYDVFEAGPGRIAIVIGDISGKGVEAARLTSLVRDGIRAYAYESTDPGEILAHVNKLMNRASPVDAFATVFLGMLETESGRLSYCGAGHPPAIVKRVGDVIPAVLAPNSTIVGAFPDITFTTAETNLAVGDVLVLYTDGITEARWDSELFGQERLLELIYDLRAVALPQLPDAILDGVLAYTGGALSDDTVVLCIGTTGVQPAS